MYVNPLQHIAVPVIAGAVLLCEVACQNAELCSDCTVSLLSFRSSSGNSIIQNFGRVPVKLLSHIVKIWSPLTLLTVAVYLAPYSIYNYNQMHSQSSIKVCKCNLVASIALIDSMMTSTISLANSLLLLTGQSWHHHTGHVTHHYY